MLSLLMYILGAVFLLSGVYALGVSNYNLGVLMTLLVGVFFILWGIFYKKLPRWLNTAVVLGFSLEFLFAVLLGVYGHCDNADYTEEAAVVLGAAVHGDRISGVLKARLDAAAEYYEKNPDALIIVSGGMGAQETVTEASAMKKYLVSAGVPESSVALEEKAGSTLENMRFSREIADGRFGEDYRVVIVTNGFHVFRAMHYAKEAGFENAVHVHGGLPLTGALPCYLRETVGVVKMWILG